VIALELGSRCCAPVHQLSTAPRQYAFGLTRFTLARCSVLPHPQTN
jgi:hypothetical protein